MHERGTRASLLGMADGANVNQILRYMKSCLSYVFIRALINQPLKHLPK